MNPLLPCLLIATLHFSSPRSGPTKSVPTPCLDVNNLDPTALQESVTKLQELGLVQDPQYWMENAVPGKSVPIGPLQELVIAAANKFQNVSSVEDALNVLQQKKILTDMERWRRQLLDRPSISGKDTIFLLYVLAQKIN